MHEAASAISLAIIGNGDIVSGFKALGFTAYAAESQDECRAASQEILSAAPCICLVQEDLFEAAEARRQQYKGSGIFIFIPFAKDAEGGMLDRMVRDIKLRATGAL
jgi:vacuolar-type H+-ATPase subunit F/Vma7